MNERRRARARFHPAALIATSFGAGYAPIAPGSVGSLVALVPAWFLLEAPLPIQIAVCAAVTVLGTVAIHVYLGDDPARDPSEVVVDEVAGCLMACLFVPREILWLGAAYLAFRVLDIAKPWPASIFDKRVKGAIGVMGDDVVAGLLAGLALWGGRVLFLQ